ASRSRMAPSGSRSRREAQMVPRGSVGNGGGPVLQASPAAHAIGAPIRAPKPQTQGIAPGAYLPVLVPQSCVGPRQAIRQAAGAQFRLPGDLEAVMSSFKGRFTVSEDQAAWEYRPREGR